MAQFVGKNGKVLALRRRARPRVQRHRTDHAVQPADAARAASGPTGPTRSRVDKKTASKLGRHGRADGRPPAAGREGAAVPRQRQSRSSANSTLGGATLAIFDLPTAQTLFDKQGQLDEIDDRRKPGYTTRRCSQQIQSVLPPHTQVRTSQAQAQKATSETSGQLSFLQYFLLAFGGIALFVGSFVIANTLSITIAQRTREFATLRSMGATGSQVRAVVVVEGFVTGAARLGDRPVRRPRARRRPRSGVQGVRRRPAAGRAQPPTRTIIISLVVGTVVTVVASLRPALRATRVPPIAAVREGSILPPSRFARFGLAGRARPLRRGGRWSATAPSGSGTATKIRLLLLAVGVLGIFLGVTMVAPRVVRPLASVLGWPATKIGGVAGVLARSNSMRNPSRPHRRPRR